MSNLQSNPGSQDLNLSSNTLFAINTESIITDIKTNNDVKKKRKENRK